MKITFLWMGKTTEEWLHEGIEVYTKRLKHYTTLSVETIQPPKNRSKYSIEQQKEIEGNAILSKITASDTVYLLDARGETYTSEQLAQHLQERMLASTKHLILITGGPFGFSEKLYHRANGQISLSKLTFSHQIVRLLLCEQIYRAFTILRGESYHHL